MPFAEVEDHVELFYEERGTGTPVIFIHGVWMSSKFFHKQLSAPSKSYRTITLDLRGHGQSSMVHHGHTIAQYARDVHAFIQKLDLKNVVLAGWSMGAFVIWDYLQQFGEDHVKGTVIVDELASDFKWPDFPIGAFDLPALTQFMRDIQSNRRAVLEGFVPLMFKEELSEDDFSWMMDEVTKMPESIASAVLFDQSIVDYRGFLSKIKKPTLLCFGREEKLIPVAAGEHLRENISDSRLEIFEQSCHCPFLEESEKFNKVVEQFIQSLND
ncbi:alpha/beta hydrolase [Fictibacillus sp. KIGAM418]|uniref:Alpha/beta hydrolase n=1 Tax=Fictibacillus marinisediminis TaxID=2878389 RepID=A0A9X1X7P2_9BACL|nr:alpha/beta hydrolase [Fictibacillus marinisediminis]MCK6255637.1 alpha/beta hydrolase [Fictibacillus marinisediminis]